MWQPTGDIGSIEVNGARVGGEHARDDVERSRLSRSVGPDQTGDGAFLNGERAAAEGLDPSIRLADLAGFKQIGYEPLLTSSV
jgi:hypothetical protein